jgi:uncharacterized protein (DUF433 family)
MRIDFDDPILAFSAEQVQRITGLTDQQLRRLDRAGVLSPTLGEEDRHRPFSRVYSFRDVVALRAIALIRESVPLEQLRALGAWLREHAQCEWSRLSFEIGSGCIDFGDSDSSQETASSPNGHAGLRTIAMQDIADEMTHAAQELRVRDANDPGNIKRQRFVLNNAPVLAGTRIPTSIVWNYIHAGYSADDVLRGFPSLTPEDVAAALEYEKANRLSAAG